MSWGIAVPPTPRDRLAEALTGLIGTWKEQQTTAPASEVDEQIDAAVHTFTALAESGAVGDGHVRGTLWGHANPDHQPTPGWADESVSVTVTWAPAVPPPEPPD